MVYNEIRIDGIDNVWASPVAAAGRVYILGRGGDAVVIEHGRQYKVLATNVLDDGFDASPAIAGDEMYLRGHQYLYCIAEDAHPEEASR